MASVCDRGCRQTEPSGHLACAWASATSEESLEAAIWTCKSLTYQKSNFEYYPSHWPWSISFEKKYITIWNEGSNIEQIIFFKLICGNINNWTDFWQTSLKTEIGSCFWALNTSPFASRVNNREKYPSAPPLLWSDGLGSISTGYPAFWVHGNK